METLWVYYTVSKRFSTEHQKSSYTCVRIIDDSMDNEFLSAARVAFVLNAHKPFPSYLNAYYPTPLLIFLYYTNRLSFAL